MPVLTGNALPRVIKSISAACEESVKAQMRNDDYVDPEDGLIHCGKCRQPRQCRVQLFGEDTVQYVICDCRKREIARDETERMREKIESLRRDGFDDPLMERSVFDNDTAAESEASVICRNYVKKFREYYERGKGLLLSGGVGTGKTFYASCVANALIEELHPCLVTSVGRYIRDMEGAEFGKKNDRIEYLNRFDLVVFDDLGVERNTSYMNELVYAIIDGRIRSGKPMIVTTNIDVRKMGAEVALEQERIYDRILSVCIPVIFKGESMRKAKAREEYRQDLNDLKGGMI